jgi:hypothetical protein
MTHLSSVNPAQARKVWETMPDASSRRVATKLRQAGARISHMTVARWRKQGWRPLQHDQQHPLEAARSLLDDAVPILTGDAMTTSRVLVEQSPEREHLQDLTDVELLREAARELAISVIVVARALMHRPETILDKTEELGVLFRSLAACAVALPAALAQAKGAARVPTSVLTPAPADRTMDRCIPPSGRYGVEESHGPATPVTCRPSLDS